MTTAAATAQRHLLYMTANGSLSPEGEDLLVVQRGESPDIDDADGRRYIDGLWGPAHVGLVVDLIPRRLRETGLLVRVCNRFVPLIGSSPR
ncbi:hypothetical protein [Streptomyces torulosus]|uniref:hypothetical protein n=1 Tax=Streptomyces torulosus TaxID=68276 RepID=UPI0006EB53F8|nr:hypothetical protein [Streptomyces torulosus]